MPTIKYTAIAAAVVLFVGHPAKAQFTTYTNPNGMGGYTITTPGASPWTTYVNPNGMGGYTTTTPGYNPYRPYGYR